MDLVTNRIKVLGRAVEVTVNDQHPITKLPVTYRKLVDWGTSLVNDTEAYLEGSPYQLHDGIQYAEDDHVAQVLVVREPTNTEHPRLDQVVDGLKLSDGTTMSVWQQVGFEVHFRHTGI